MRLYIGCGLTHVPRDKFIEYTEFIHTLASTLESKYEVRYALRDSDPQLAEKDARQRARLCYLWDRQMVEQAGMMIAEVSFASTGLGIELQLAESKGIPLVVCYRDWGDNRADPIAYETPDHRRHQLQIGSGYASLMAFGLPNVVETIEYSDPTSGVIDIQSAVARLVQRETAEIA